MGKTHLTYLKKIQDGVVFSEGFENLNFIQAEGWDILQGIPATSTAQARSADGISSWDNSANSNSGPIASKTLPSTSSMAVVWFYDDMNTTEEGPYFKVKCTAGNFFLQVGVRNAVSDTYYSCNTASSFTEDDFDLTAVSRTQGWHQFIIESWSSPGTSTFLIWIDGVNVFTAIAGIAFGISKVYLCSGAIGDASLKSFGYFDELQCFQGTSSAVPFTIFAAPVVILQDISIIANMYDSTNTKLFSGYHSGTLFPLNPDLGVCNIDFPILGYFEIGDSATGLLRLRTPLMRINPGDIYGFHDIEFGRRVLPYKPSEDTLSNFNQSTSGVGETLFNAFKTKYQFGFKNLEGFLIKEKLNNWFRHAKQGNPFSLMIDSIHVGFGVISSTPTVGTKTVTIMPNLYTNPTDSFEVGRQYVLFNGENTYRQTVTLDSKNTTTLTFKEYLEESVQALDYIADDTFKPFLEIGQNSDGLQMANERQLWWNLSQNCQDYNQG